MRFGETAQQAGQEVGRDGGYGTKPDAAATSGLGKLGKRVLHELQNVLGAFQQEFAMISEHDLAWFALKQRLAELFFEFLNGPAQRGLGKIQFFRRTGEVPGPCQGHELFEQVEIEFVAHPGM